MTIVTITEAKNRFYDLINLADNGENVVITRDNKPKIKLVVVDEKPKKRVFGQHRGKIMMSPDFDAPLADNFWGSDKS